MSAACLETSDPAIPMATPMSAFFRAGESLTPSPVTATMAPIRWQPSTMINFCWGEVLANTISVWYIRISSICFSLMSLISPPWTTQALASLGDDTNGPGDSLGSDGMVASHHDDLDTSRPTLGDGVGHSSSGGINHGHQSNKSETLQREVNIVSIKGISNGVLISGKHEVAETKNSLSESTELHVGSLKGILPFLSHGEFSALHNNGGASVQNPLRRSLHHQQLPVVVLVLSLVNGDLELVGGVEWDLANLVVFLPVLHHVAVRKLGALEDSGFRGVTIDFSLQDGDSLLTSLELSTVAEHTNSFQGLPARGFLPGSSLGTRLVLGGVGLHDLVVEPHVGHSHPVLGQCSGLVGTDGGGGAKRLHGLEVLDETVLAGHPLSGEGEADSDGGQETLGHVGYDDTDQEDDGVQPVVSENEGDDEEGDAEEDSDSSDDVDEVSNLLSNGSLVALQRIVVGKFRG